MLKIQVITLFPDIFQTHLSHLPLSRAIKKGVLQVDFFNLRDFALDKRGTVDSPPYGGGPGMILRPEPIYDAINFALGHEDATGLLRHCVPRNDDSGQARMTDSVSPNDKMTEIIFLTPKGKTYNQKIAEDFSKLKQLIIVCGRYEGMDQRVIDLFVDNKNFNALELSIGNYVLSGGEVAAMAILESVARLLPGAIENPQTLENESFSKNRVEHAQYSRPEIWKGLKPPEELLTGHHKNIEKWKESNSPELA